jgi:glycosyltransferase involved in cell wall biosynthesis
LNQSRVPDEVIVVDDGSTDGTHRLLAAYGPPVRVIRQPNGGRSAARNTGLRAAQGDLILCLDSDDLLAPRCLEHCAHVLEQNPAVSVVYTDAHVIDVDGRTVGLYSQVLRGHRPSGNVFGELARRCFLTVSSMVRRSCLEGAAFEVGMEHCEDYDLWRRLAARCEFQFLDEPLMCYRFHDGMTNAVEHVNILTSEIEVQRRFMAMPQFARLSRRQRARAYCTHGIKNAIVGRMTVARRFFRKALWTSPAYPGGIALTLVSLCGAPALRYAIVKRRRLAGNQLGTPLGPLAVVGHEPASQARAPGMPESVETIGCAVLSENL